MESYTGLEVHCYPNRNIKSTWVDQVLGPLGLMLLRLSVFYYEFPVCLGLLAAWQSTSSKLEDLVLVLLLADQQKHMLNGYSDPKLIRVLSLHWIYSNLERQVLSSLFLWSQVTFSHWSGRFRLNNFLGPNQLSFSMTWWTQILAHSVFLNLYPIHLVLTSPLPSSASRFVL